jgi:hypothetical protein
MRNLLPYLFLLACPVMMIFMMRGMRGGGHATGETSHDTRPRQDEPGTPEERIAALEREVAQLRALRGERPEHRWARQS